MVEDELDTLIKVTASARAADNITGSSDVNKSTPLPSKKARLFCFYGYTQVVKLKLT